MKTYNVSYIIKANCKQYEESMKVDAENSKEASKMVSYMVKARTGRHAFDIEAIEEGKTRLIGVPVRPKDEEGRVDWDAELFTRWFKTGDEAYKFTKEYKADDGQAVWSWKRKIVKNESLSKYVEE